MERKKCLNCGKGFIDTDLFCTKCGQKTKLPKLTVWEIISDFLSNVFNLEARIYKTLFHIFNPAKLTKAYVAGERKKYYNPIRILFIAMIIHFALLASLVKRDTPNLNRVNMESEQKLIKSDLIRDIDSIAPQYLAADQLQFIDSIKHAVHLDNLTSKDSFFLYHTNIIDLDFSEEKILLEDIFALTEDEIIKKYEIEGQIKQLSLKQTIKIYKDPSDLPAFLIGNTLWTVAIVLLFIAFVMKLLYIRNRVLYVEHLVFLMHVHSVAFLVGSVILSIIFFGGYNLINIDLGNNSEPSGILPGLDLLGIGIAALFFLLAQKVYYQQGWIKTIIKLFIIMISYIFILLFAAIVVSLLSLIFF